MKKTKMEKGITLVALIITIVILLILAAVAIAAIQNENILSHANNAALKYNQAVQNEQDILEGYLNYLDNLGGSGSGSQGGGSTGTEVDPVELDLVEKYVLGVEKTGRSALEIANLDMSTMTITSFKDEASTISDASTTMSCLYMDESIDRTKRICICKI